MRYYFQKKYKRFKTNDICIGFPIKKNEKNDGTKLVFDDEKTRELIENGVISSKKKISKPKKVE